MSEDLDAIHLRACGCDGWKPDPDEPVRSLMDHVVEPLLARIGSPDRETVVEHATMMSGGVLHIRNDHPEIERIYPLAMWLEHQIGSGATVYRREVVVVSDWSTVDGA